MPPVIVLNPDEGEILGGGAYQLRFLAESPDQPIDITENSVPPHFPGPVPHRHERMTDIFYVLEGTMTLHFDGEQRQVGPGGYALIPPGVEHTFSNDGDVPLRFLNIYQPSGNEHYLKEVGKRIATRNPPRPDEMAVIASRYDVIPVPGNEDHQISFTATFSTCFCC
jgi:mannose-6-phosphate isomerase-like protein (cupin superfamily)